MASGMLLWLHLGPVHLAMCAAFHSASRLPSCVCSAQQCLPNHSGLKYLKPWAKINTPSLMWNSVWCFVTIMKKLTDSACIWKLMMIPAWHLWRPIQYQYSSVISFGVQSHTVRHWASKYLQWTLEWTVIIWNNIGPGIVSSRYHLKATGSYGAF